MLKLLTAATATNSPPSGATAGKALSRVGDEGNTWPGADRAMVLVASTAGSGTMTVTIKLWGYSPVSATWHPLGTNATAATKGIINEGNSIGETGTDTIAHAEIVQGLSAFSRVYAEVTASGGTATAVSLWLVPVMGDR